MGIYANMHLDMSSSNLGVQEYRPTNEALHDVFPGCPEIDQGYAYLKEKPGLGIDINEAKTAQYPCEGGIPSGTMARAPDGTVSRS